MRELHMPARQPRSVSQIAYLVVLCGLTAARTALADNVVIRDHFNGTATHRLKMVLDGGAIQVWYDGVLRLSATDAFNVAATKHGFRWLSYYNWQSTYSNFEVDGNFVPPAATVTVTPTPTTVPLFQ